MDRLQCLARVGPGCSLVLHGGGAKGIVSESRDGLLIAQNILSELGCSVERFAGNFRDVG
jgi:hypothetical protein